MDLSKINHKPMPVRSPTGDHPVTAILKVRVEASQAELAGVESPAVGHSADFERERELRLIAELLRATADTMAAKEAVARLEGEPAALRRARSHK